MAKRKYLILIALLPLISLAQVPNTETFSLQDVVNEISPTSNDLETCFDESATDRFDPDYVPSGFDPHAADKTGYEQYYFRNYGFILSHIGHSFGNGVGRVYNDGSDWLNVIQSSIGLGSQDSPYTTDLIVTDDNGSGNYRSTRLFMTFDLSGINSNANIQEAYIMLGYLTDYGDKRFTVVAASQGSSIENSDYDQIDINTVYASESSYKDVNGGDYTRIGPVNSTQVSNIEAKLGGTMQVAILHDDDFDALDLGSSSYAPSSKKGMEVFLEGETTAYDEAPPYIVIRYTL